MPRQSIPLTKNFSAPKGAGAFQSAWLSSGQPGAGVASPLFTAGAGYTCDRTTLGAADYTNPVTSNELAQWIASANVQGTLFLFDRLWSCSGMGFANATYTVTTPGTLPARYASGKGCRLFVENFVAAGAASGTLTANYLESNAGNAAKSGVIAAVVSAPVAGQLQPVPLQAGSEGIHQLTSVVTSATWTSGTWGMTIMKLIAAIPINPGTFSSVLDYAQCALAKIPTNACLQLAWQAVSATAPSVFGEAVVIDGNFTTVDAIVAELSA